MDNEQLPVWVRRFLRSYRHLDHEAFYEETTDGHNLFLVFGDFLLDTAL